MIDDLRGRGALHRGSDVARGNYNDLGSLKIMLGEELM